MKARTRPARLALRGTCALPVAIVMALASAMAQTMSTPTPAPTTAATPAPAPLPLPDARLCSPEPLSPWIGLDAEVEHLVARGELPAEALTFRPVDRAELSAWVARIRGTSPARARLAEALPWAAECPECPPAADSTLSTDTAPSPRPRGSILHFTDGGQALTVTPYLRGMPTFESGRAPRWSDSSRVGFRAIFRAGRALVISSGFYAAVVEGSERFADPLIAGTDFILHADEATISARLGALRLRLGRDRHHWGPGVSGSLLLSEQATPFNFVEYQLRLGERVRFLALTGVTSRAAAEADSGTGANPAAHRYLAAHRLLWNARSNLSLSFSEGARYQDSGPHPLYLAGILPYTLVERLDQQDEPNAATRGRLRNNVLWSVDALWRPLAALMLYGEVLADDIATESSEMPTRGGYQIGCTYAPRTTGCDWTFGAEYTRVSNYTYSVYYQNDCLCDWDHQARPIGYGRGPDVKVLLLRAAASMASRWQARGWLRWVEKGAGAIGSPWTPASSGCDPATDPDCGDRDAWSLAPPVNETIAIGMEARYRPDPLVWVGAALERLWDRRADGSGCACGAGGSEGGTRLRLFLSAGR